MAGISRHGKGWDAVKVLDSYIYDYMKKNMPEAAEIFAREANVLDKLPPDNEGLLSDWWSVFWDMYSAKSRSSSVQLDNVLQSMRQETPVVIYQPAPLGVDLDSTMMTGQHPSPPLFDRQAISQVQTIAGARSQQEELQAKLLDIARVNNIR